ncbi:MULTISPECIES: hypothetical protein [Saccharopolyspora]|uniref:Uncharacterized protein n=1 Tax=Saccharopolyspora cebuensis TaxID=418759 RepID=A0ABV4CQN8_9PSEU
MDDRELRELFREAVSAAPESSFDERDVARASRRITARRRIAAAGGTFAAAAVLVGGLGWATGMFGGDQQQTAAVAQRTAPPPAESTGPGVLMEPMTRSAACGPPDAQLAAAVAAELPAVAATSPVPADGPCPPGTRAAKFVLRDGAAAGTVTVSVVPSPEGAEATDVRHPDGAQEAVRQTRSGQRLVVVSRPDAGSTAPYGERIPLLAGDLAARY